MKIAISVFALVFSVIVGLYGLLIHKKLPTVPPKADIDNSVVKAIFDKVEKKESDNLPPKDSVVSAPLTSDQKYLDLLARVEVSEDPELYYGLGEILENGLNGVQPNIREAYMWYEKAARKNHKIGLYNIGVLLMASGGFEDNVEAYNYMVKSADQGYALAQLAVGKFLAEAVYVEQDVEKALQYLSLAAAQGLADADYNIGLIYQRGLGIEEEPVKAFESFMSAAVKGQSDGQLSVGLSYYFGYGVEKDIEKARFWLNKALINGKVEAAEILQNIRIA